MLVRITSSFNQSVKRFLSTAIRRCDSCDYSKIYVCNTCQLPIDNFTFISPFNLFKLPLQYMIDKSILKSYYLQYQNLLHPDKHSQATEEDLKLITNSSSHVNNSYKLLLDDKKRGIELLTILNQDTNLDECNIGDVFEIHESIDALESDLEAKELKGTIDARIGDLIIDIDKSFNEKNYDKVRNNLSMLGYLNTITKRLDTYDDV